MSVIFCTPYVLSGIALLGSVILGIARESAKEASQHLLEINSVTVAGENVPLLTKGEIKLPASSKEIQIRFGPPEGQNRLPTRIRFRLSGYEHDWQIGEGFMCLAVRFYNSEREQIDQRIFKAFGESANWTGSLQQSGLVHRRERVVAPTGAAHIMIVISSAGPPSTEGVYVVANLRVSKVSEKSEVLELMRDPFDKQEEINDSMTPVGWTRDGLVRNMAKIVKTGPEPATKAFAILDNDPQGHAEWRNEMETMPDVTPGDNLIIEWNEMFTVGVEDSRVANYDRLSPGKYTFEAENIDIYGIPTGEKAVLDVLVLPPFWKTTWFWGTSLALFTFVMFAGVRYAANQKLKQEMVRSKNREALERERIRIAQDIHDDLGARVTQISLISAMANRNPEFSDKARTDFDQITRHARELVAALYETVWAVNPENDNLSALGNYLCQMVNQLCERAQFSCRFDVDELPRNVQASSQIRHNVTMVVKEAIHNVIKYANATEVTIGVAFKDDVLSVSVSDNGQGFQPSARQRSRHGLVNMQKRMEELGGSCQIESEPGRGTTVVMTLRFKSPKAY